MIIARNIKVIDLMRVLSNYDASQFIDIGIVLGENNNPDQIKIMKTKTVQTNSSNGKKFELKNLNDYI